MQQLLLPRAKRHFLRWGVGRSLHALNAQPSVLKRYTQTFGAVFEPHREIVARLTHSVQLRVVARTVVPEKFVSREDAMHVEMAAIKLP